MAVQIAGRDWVAAVSAGVAMFAGVVVFSASRPAERGRQRKQPFTTKVLKAVSVFAFAVVLLLLIVKYSLKLFPSVANDLKFQSISDFLHDPWSFFSPGDLTVKIDTTGHTADGHVHISVNKIYYDLDRSQSRVDFTVGISNGETQSFEKKIAGNTVWMSGYEIRVTEIDRFEDKASFQASRMPDPAGTTSKNP
jgi:hypothetical protein